MSVYDNMQPEEMNNVRHKVEDNSKIIDDIVNDIVRPYTKSLDRYVEFIANCLKDGERPPRVVELEDFCMNLSTYIYFAGGMCEQLGIRDDISKAVYKEIYHSNRSSLEHGTVADKDSLAELASQQEYLTNVCYSRAYKTMKSKVDAAQELLSSCKKVLSSRLSERELTRMDINK